MVVFCSDLLVKQCGGTLYLSRVRVSESFVNLDLINCDIFSSLAYLAEFLK